MKDFEKLYNNHFSDFDLINIKEDIFSMPYEKIGCQLIYIFRENFKIINLFLIEMSTLINN